MRRTCDLCAKKTMVGRNRSHAQNRTARTFMANVQKVTIKLNDDDKISGNFCTKCIKRMRKEISERSDNTLKSPAN